MHSNVVTMAAKLTKSQRFPLPCDTLIEIGVQVHHNHVILTVVSSLSINCFFTQIRGPQNTYSPPPVVLVWLEQLPPVTVTLEFLKNFQLIESILACCRLNSESLRCQLRTNVYSIALNIWAHNTELGLSGIEIYGPRTCSFGLSPIYSLYSRLLPHHWNFGNIKGTDNILAAFTLFRNLSSDCLGLCTDV
jgi:hypothetical protein